MDGWTIPTHPCPRISPSYTSFSPATPPLSPPFLPPSSRGCTLGSTSSTVFFQTRLSRLGRYGEEGGGYRGRGRYGGRGRDAHERRRDMEGRYRGCAVHAWVYAFLSCCSRLSCSPRTNNAPPPFPAALAAWPGNAGAMHTVRTCSSTSHVSHIHSTQKRALWLPPPRGPPGSTDPSDFYYISTPPLRWHWKLKC